MEPKPSTLQPGVTGVIFQPALKAHMLSCVSMSPAGAVSGQGREPLSHPSIHSLHFSSYSASWAAARHPQCVGLESCDVQTTDGP